MRNILALILTLSAISSSAQEWFVNQIDSVFAITMPDDYETIDTLGQRILRAQIPGGLIMVMTMANKGITAVNVENEADLLGAYNGFQKGMTLTQGGEIISTDTLDIDGLKFSLFSYRATLDGERQVRYCMVGYIRDRTYAVNFWELESTADEMAPLRDQLFSSVQLSNTLTIKDQMSYAAEGTLLYKAGYAVGLILAILLIPGLIIFAIVWFVRRKKKAKGSASA